MRDMTGSKRLNVARLKRESDVDGLIEALEARVIWKTRAAAAEALGDLGDTRAVEPLSRLLGDGYLVGASATALAKIGDERAVDELIECLRHEPSHWGPIRTSPGEAAAHATLALATIVPPGSVERLIAIAKDESEDERTRVGAVDVLARMNQPGSNEFLTSALSVPGLQTVAVMGIGNAAGASAVDGALLGPVIEPLIRRLDDTDWQARGAAVTALGEIDDPRVMEPLIGALQDDIYDVRRRAVIALTDRGDPSAIEPLRRAAERETDARDWVLMRLRQLTGEEFEEFSDAAESPAAVRKPRWKFWG